VLVELEQHVVIPIESTTLHSCHQHLFTSFVILFAAFRCIMAFFAAPVAGYLGIVIVFAFVIVLLLSIGG
jgi:hypothetical protein